MSKIPPGICANFDMVSGDLLSDTKTCQIPTLNFRGGARQTCQIPTLNFRGVRQTRQIPTLNFRGIRQTCQIPTLNFRGVPVRHVKT